MRSYVALLAHIGRQKPVLLLGVKTLARKEKEHLRRNRWVNLSAVVKYSSRLRYSGCAGYCGLFVVNVVD